MNGATVALAVKAREAARRRDPLAHYRPHPGQLRALKSLVLPGLRELHLRCPNWWGKTFGLAAIFLALAQRRRSLWGIPLPALRHPSAIWALSRNYLQQVESVQAAYIKALGEWPAEVVWLDRGKQQIAQINVKPGEGPDFYPCEATDAPETWSKIVFRSQHNMTEKADIALGVRLDAVHGDEPPLEWVWRELRKAGRENAPFLMAIGETPLKRSEWEWIRADFAGALDRMLDGRLEITGTMDDVLVSRGGFATQSEVDAKFEAYKGDPYIEARKTGEYLDVEGDSPFGQHGFQVLQRWKADVWEGQGKTYEIVKQDADGGFSGISVEVERWWRAEPGEWYYAVWDLTGGMQHPAEGQVYAMRKPRLVARYGAKIGVDRSGVLEPFACGYLAALIQRDYPCVVDFESNAGYGASFMRGFKEAGGVRAIKDIRLDKGGKLIEQFGFNTNKFSRARWIAGCQEVISQNAVRVPSIDVVECLMALRLDKNDRIVDEDHRHAEAMICLGRFADYYADVGKRRGHAPPPVKPRSEAVSDYVEAVMVAEQGMEGVRLDKPETNGALVDFG